uniref:Uncharacterized protein n=1 Tax=Bionectria ochroleuca TaxID=29856 RepID=A0A8H7K390_BIOOC
MSVSVKFVDWEDDFRYNEERERVTNMIQRIAAEKGYTHGVVQKLWIKQRYRTMVGLQVTVHLQKIDWVGNQSPHYVPVRIHFTEDCTLQDIEGNPEWHPKVNETT